ncbi:MAG: hypothetical protein OJF50_004285 [Nitrospira sp.]|nr:hypothetical protein [Nitrospira sp.]
MASQHQYAMHPQEITSTLRLKRGNYQQGASYPSIAKEN